MIRKKIPSWVICIDFSPYLQVFLHGFLAILSLFMGFLDNPLKTHKKTYMKKGDSFSC